MNIKLISGLIFAICAAQAHALTDEPIECEVLDPEIHDALGIMVYQHLNTSTNAREAIVQFIEDGDLVGDVEVLENDLAPFPVSLAGPKYSHGENTSNQLEDYLAYTRQIDSQTFAVGVRRYSENDPACGQRTPGGQAYVVYGGADLGSEGVIELAALDGENGFTINGIDPSDYAGFAVAGPGDVNGDGIDDLLIGAFGADPNGVSRAARATSSSAAPSTRTTTESPTASTTARRSPTPISATRTATPTATRAIPTSTATGSSTSPISGC